MVECQWYSVVPSPSSPELSGLGLSFVLALCMVLGFDCCWVCFWWVFPSSWLIYGHSLHHLLYSVVQMWTGCVEADSSVYTRFWGFSLALVQFFVLSNFFTLWLYFQISHGLRLVWLPELFHLLPLLFVDCSFVGGFHLLACVLVFTTPTLQVLWSSKVKFFSLRRLLGWPLFVLALVFSELQVLLSHLWEKEKKKKRKEGKRNRKGKEGKKKEGIKKDWRKEKKKEF